jgi:hypothetical protein
MLKWGGGGIFVSLTLKMGDFGAFLRKFTSALLLFYFMHLHI